MQTMQTRQRVDFMSQAFPCISLYGELTVAQNMTLHARLFHLAPTQAAQRINTLIIRHFCLPFCRCCHRYIFRDYCTHHGTICTFGAYGYALWRLNTD